MLDNTISAKLSTDDQAVIFAAIATVKEKLPFLVGLTQEKKKGLSRMGDKTQGFVFKAIKVATQNTNLMPRCLDVDEMV
jgi:hypothetical protein